MQKILTVNMLAVKSLIMANNKNNKIILAWFPFSHILDEIQMAWKSAFWNATKLFFLPLVGGF